MTKQVMDVRALSMKKSTVSIRRDYVLKIRLSDEERAILEDRRMMLPMAELQFARALTGQAHTAEAIGIMSEPVGDSSELDAFLGSPVLYAQTCSWIRLETGLLNSPTMQPEPALRALLEKQAKAMLSDVATTDSLLSSVHDSLVAQLQFGEPTLEQTAADLSMSSRTLHRRFQERDCQFSQVLAETRSGIAEHHLRNPQLSLADIALFLGYSEQSSFTYAFKRWTGMTPSDWRKQKAH